MNPKINPLRNLENQNNGTLQTFDFSSLPTKPTTTTSCDEWKGSTYQQHTKLALTIKLSETIFCLWRSMVLVILKGQQLDGLILGTKTCLVLEFNSHLNKWIVQV